MRISPTDSFKRDFRRLPADIQRRAEKTIVLLSGNPRHPSLRTKKMKGPHDVWEARVSVSYRVTFQFVEDEITLRRIDTHDILTKE